MASSPSVESPLAVGGRSNMKGFFTQSPTSPAMPSSKKDKRRSLHAAHIKDLKEDFSSNRETHYRRQLIALQNDMNLITHADPYQPEPMEDSPDEIARLSEHAASGTAYQSEMSSLAGKWYAEFVSEVNDAKEDKELALIRLTNNHNSRLERLRYECDYRLHLAAEEAEHMTSTLRERLVTTLSQKRQRLMKEKEQLDIADTNALLLHPSQFTITNPASPGGGNGQTSRKTRTTRHRGEQDDLNNGFPEVTNKRKRKLIDEEMGSPSRNGTSTPAGRGARLDALARQTAPAYTVSALFTEKEMNLQSHQAQIAARHFFSTSHKEGEANGSKKRRMDAEEEGRSPIEGDLESSEDEELEAPDMDRTASQNVHVTRSTRTIGGLAGLNILSDLAEKVATRPALPYATLHTHQQKSGILLPPPSRLMDTELEEDLVRFAQYESQPKGLADKKVIEDALKPITEGRSNLAPDWPVYLDVHLVDVDPRKTARVV